MKMARDEFSCTVAMFTVFPAFATCNQNRISGRLLGRDDDGVGDGVVPIASKAALASLTALLIIARSVIDGTGKRPPAEHLGRRCLHRQNRPTSRRLQPPLKPECHRCRTSGRSSSARSAKLPDARVVARRAALNGAAFKGDQARPGMGLSPSLAICIPVVPLPCQAGSLLDGHTPRRPD